jgi:hypothetical protein
VDFVLQVMQLSVAAAATAAATTNSTAAADTDLVSKDALKVVWL